MFMLTSTHERILTAQLDRLEGIVAELLEQNLELSKLATRHRPDASAKLAEKLADRNEDLMDRLQEMVGTVHHHQVRQYSAPAFEPTDTPASLYSSEEEDDLRYMERHGLIDSDELAQALREADFLNSDIDMHG